MSAESECHWGPERCIVWPEIVECILSFCNGKTLATALRVCKVWSQQSRRILDSRRQWVSYMSCMGTVEACLDDLKPVVENVPFYPAAAIVFCSFSTSRSTNKVKATLSRLLPNSCHLIGAHSTGVMGMVYGHMTVEKEEEPGITLILAPRIPSVYFSAFSLSTTSSSSRSSQANGGCMQLMAESGDGRDDMGLPRQAVDDVRCVVVLASEFKDVQIADKIRECYGLNVAICGAISSSLGKGKSSLLISGPACGHKPVSKEPFDAVCLVMAGRLHCATKCIGRGFHWPPSSGGLEELLSKNISASGHETAAAIFSCCGLGVQYFDQTNFETQQLRKVYPHIPVIGMFGNGEISSCGDEARHFGPEGTKSSTEVTCSAALTDLIRSYSSVFCLWSLLPPA